VRFNYAVVVDTPDSLQVVTSGVGTGLVTGNFIQETFNNLSDRAQRAVITVTPYTVTSTGITRCLGTPRTIDIWVEPTARLTLVPPQDTICDGETTNIEILSPTQPTLPVRFNYAVVVDTPDSLQVVTSGVGTGLVTGNFIQETFNNLSDRAQRAVITVTPYTVTSTGITRCLGTPRTIDIWVEPTARLTLVPPQDTICDGETTNIEILSPTQPTLPVRFNYAVVVDTPDSLQVVTSGVGTGLVTGNFIQETFNNLSDRAQRAVITVTPYTVTSTGITRCLGTPRTIDIWVEPTARLTLVPPQDTICDGETTNIEILSPTQPTLPVRFNYAVVVDTPDSLQVVTSGVGTGLVTGNFIQETFNNLSDRAQRAVITVTPYTVTSTGITRCLGTPRTIDIWVEPTARLTLVPPQDTICDGETTNIEILSPTQPTLPVRFNYAVVVDTPDSLQVVTSGVGTGLVTGNFIQETFNNLSDRAQRAVITVTPYTVTSTGITRCLGTPRTIDIWVEPTARLTLVPPQDTICDGETTNIEILSPTQPTLPVRFNYAVVVDTPDSLQVVTSGVGTGLVTGNFIQETFNNLSDRAQRAVITVTPYTVTSTGITRCLGTPRTIDIWVEPTARLTLVPPQDTICDGETTNIEILSPTQPTLPVRFNYAVVVDTPDSLQVVTSGVGTGLVTGNFIQETFNNLSDRAQRAVITVTPYTVTSTGITRCLGTPRTIDIWVEPTARLTLVPPQDTICDGETTNIEILSPTQPTLPVRFNYAVVVDTPDSLQVVTSGVGTGLVTGNFIQETFNNLSDRAQRAVITVTPYTVTSTGITRCLGTPRTIDIWVEPTARLTLVPPQDTICDGETTNIEILSPTQPTLPVRFNYAVVVDTPDSLQVVTSGVGTGLVTGNFIQETFNNLSDRAQRAVITVTPYTVTSTGITRCLGTPRTIDIWVEPTARLTLVPPQDTICDGETTNIEILSPTQPTLPVRFNYAVVVDTPDSLQVVTSGVGTGLVTGNFIQETFNNLSDRAQRAVITVTPYTVTSTGITRCLGTPRTIDIWVEPTARLTLVPPQDTICDGETTNIEILSPTQPTLPVRFNYAVVVDTPDSLQVVTSGVGTGLVTGNFIQETFNNLSDRAQRAVITVTPYTVTSTGITRCLGTPRTIDIWVEPTARLTLVPPQDTICDGETTNIEILSPTQPTLPVRFNYAVVVDTPDSLQVVTSGVGTGLVTGNFIQETFNNLSDRAQRAVITVTPYTVTSTGITRCLGTPRTIDIWVEPTARLTLVPPQDTICDGETTNIEILSPTQPTLPVRFNYAVVVDTPDSLQVVTSGVGTGLVTGNFIQETFNNLSDRAQRAVITVTPYTVTSTGITRCLGTPRTIDIWVEPTARLTLVPPQDTICDGETTNIEILSPTQPTLPVRFNYAVVVDTPDSLQVVTSGVGTGLVTGNFIQETFNNLSDRAQRAVITVTPYTVTSTGITRCLGTPRTIDIWVEPTARLTLVPPQDTICDGETTNIEILSPTQPTLPVRFNYAVVVDTPDSLQVVTSGVGTGLVTGNFIQETFNNLSDRAQRAVITVTPYTVTSTGITRCLGTPRTIDIWVEPTARLTLVPPQDTICDGETTNIEILSPTQPTLPVRFNYAVVVDTPDSLQVVTSGVGTGLVTGNFIQETFNNLSDRAQRAVITVTPYTVTSTGITRCLGTPRTIDIWVEPTARLTLVPPQDTICDGETTNIEILSPTQPTLPVRFNYAVVVDTPDSLQVVTSGVGTGLVTGNFIQETFNNLSDRAQRAVITVTPYTVTSTGITRCLGTPRTIDIWVEPTARLTLVPPQDTICDGETTNIEILSPTQPTLPVRFNYAVVVDTPDSLQVVTSGVGTGLVTGNFIQETFNNLSDRAQRAVITVTPYTVTSTGITRCLGTPRTIDIWVEPTARLTLVPPQDTICDGETTNIEILSPTQPTLPVRFNYAVVVDTPDSLQVVTSGVGTGLVTGNFIQETFNNLSDRAQRAVITVTPYTVTSTGITRCLGTPRTIDIWVEPTARLTLVPPQDTICDGETTNIEILSPTQPTLPVRFNYAVVVDTPDSLQVVTSGVGTGLVTGNFIQETFNNLSDRAQRAVITVTPYTVTSTGITRCLGTPRTIDIWVEPTARLTLVPPQDTICDGETTNIEILSPTQPTLPVRFNYAVVVDTPDSLQVVTSGVGTGLVTGNFIQETFNNLSDRAQRAVITVTPYTVTSTGITRCLGTPRTIDIWVEPTARLTLVPPQDTICDGETTNIEILSPTQPTLPVRFNYAVVVDTPDSLQVVTSGVGTGLVTGNFIQETFNNLSDRAQRAVITVTPYTVTSTGITRCLGTPRTIDIWVEPTARLTLVPPQDTICDGETTNIEILSPTQPTLPVRFNYAVVVDTPDSLQVVTSGVGTGLVTGNFIQETFNNLSDRAQRAVITVTPYTVTSTGITRCLGTPRTIDIWVEPTARLTLVPPQDTICDGETTNIEILSPTQPTLPVRFNYAVVVDTPDSLQVVTSGVGTGLVTGNFIQETFNNLSDRAQRAVITVTPYTVTSTGITRCLGTPRTIDIWVEPTARLFSYIDNDTICNDGTINITWTSPTVPTIDKVFNVTVVNPFPEITNYTTGTGMPVTTLITNSLNNSGDTARMIMYVISPVLLDSFNNQKCPGVNDTIRVWVNPTPRAIPIVEATRICDSTFTSVLLTTPSVMTKGQILFDYTITLTGGPGDLVGNTNFDTGLLPGQRLQFRYSNRSDTVQSVHYLITPRNDILTCAPGLIADAEVKVHPVPIQDLLLTNPVLCQGGSDGALRVVLAKGTNPYDIRWRGPYGYTNSNIIEPTNLQEGTYWARVTDFLGCTDSLTYFIIRANENTNFTTLFKAGGASAYNTSCYGAADGEIELYITNGNSFPFDYWVTNDAGDTLYTGTMTENFSFANPASRRVFGGLVAGWYYIDLEDVNGCRTRYQQEIRSPEPIVNNLTAKAYAGGFNISCRSYNDGKAWVASSFGGNFGPRTFLWSTTRNFLPGTTTPGDTLRNLIAGTYYMRVTDFYGCTKVDSITLIQPDGIELLSTELSFSADSAFNVSCNGGANGSIDLNFGGGSGTYLYTWTGPAGANLIQGAEDQTNLIAGTYHILVTDLNGCVNNYSFTLTQPDSLKIAATPSATFDNLFNINCFGGTGAISLAVTGGSINNYTYNWTTSNGSGIVQGARDQSTLTAGTYTVVVIDSNSCVTESIINLTQPDPIVTSLVPVDITCEAPGFSNGSIDMTVTGGSGTYSYLWSNGETTKDVSGLTQGKYFVTVTDMYGCSTIDSAVINLPPPLTVNVVKSNYNGLSISCFGLADGSITVTPLTGEGPFTYLWTGPDGYTATAGNITALKAGTYTVTVTDANMCTVTEIIEMTQSGPIGMIVSLSASNDGMYNINCAGSSTGTINLTPVNAVGSLQWLWSDGATGTSRAGIPAGDYRVILTDQNLCSKDSVITITQPDSIRITLAIIHPQCLDNPNGEIAVSVTGGSPGPGYQFKWSDNSTDQNRDNLFPGKYKVLVTDFNGCTATDSVKLEALQEICLEIPNAFSPNGDGINDEWNIGMIYLYPEMEVSIFNRQGQLIWRSERGYPGAWNGRSNGRALPMDSYHYVINLPNGRKPIVGNVTIVR
jgi:gliding motility-associated-like protein